MVPRSAGKPPLRLCAGWPGTASERAEARASASGGAADTLDGEASDGEASDGDADAADAEAEARDADVWRALESLLRLVGSCPRVRDTPVAYSLSCNTLVRSGRGFHSSVV